eukprot:16434889-Heterocapsa_arctica.AAC.1
MKQRAAVPKGTSPCPARPGLRRECGSAVPNPKERAWLVWARPRIAARTQGAWAGGLLPTWPIRNGGTSALAVPGRLPKKGAY